MTALTPNEITLLQDTIRNLEYQMVVALQHDDHGHYKDCAERREELVMVVNYQFED